VSLENPTCSGLVSVILVVVCGGAAWTAAPLNAMTIASDAALMN